MGSPTGRTACWGEDEQGSGMRDSRKAVANGADFARTMANGGIGMIEATPVHEGGRHTLRMTGHATGNELVCAGASAIAYALLGALQNMDGHVRYLDSETASGALWVCAEGDGQVEAVFLMAVVGLLQIEKAHPGSIHVAV